MANKIKVTIEMVDEFCRHVPGVSPLQVEKGLAAALAVRSKKPAATGRAELMQILGEVLPAHYAAAIIDHRIAKRAPLTPLAAQLLMKQFQECGNPVAGAEMQLERGWQGFKAKWYLDEIAKERGGSGRNFNGGLSQARAQLRQEIDDENRHASPQGADYRDVRRLPFRG